ncbi:hypothetical protein ACFQPA_15390 [Halomarina halobia]|uniref:DUF7344 domain-containing protein n=1 Tax=Halomarina halobia TaxID=3033386 RepID=A0ABD6A856_9EURY|nr:hypothetical protein [Halomarina sp. PSR21]
MTVPDDADGDAHLETALHPVQRFVLSTVREHVSVTLADLADEVSVRERGRPLPEIPETDVLERYFDLYETHVPALADRDVVTYDPASDRVWLAGHDPAATALDETLLNRYQSGR